MKNFYTFLIIVSFVFSAKAQVTWSDDVAEVVYNNCASCHNPNGIAPFSLLDYQDAYDFRLAISSSVGNGDMPPWTADTTYQRYSHERILTASEKAAILDWVAQGAPEGNAANTPPQPVFANEGFLTQTPDLVLQAPVYTSKASFISDDYVCFSVPTGLTTSKKLKAFEVIPGNPSIVHHALIYTDPTGAYPTDTTSGACNGPAEDGLLGGYTPGALPTVFPGQGNINFGYNLEAGSNIIFAMHYPAGSAGFKDSTKIRLYFYDDATTIREVRSVPVLNRITGSKAFTIPANTIDTIYDQFDGLPLDVSILSVFPHMHLLGKSIEAYAVTPSNDTIKYARINEWDFDWQEFLFFEYIKKFPANSAMKGRAIYDNTSNNHHNPNDPPIDVSGGYNTTDEMFLVYFHFSLYEPGDEFLNLDSLTQEFYSVQVEEYNKAASVKVYPNPFKNETTLSLDVNAAVTSLYIYDMRGQLVNKLLDRAKLVSGENQITWSGTNEEGSVVPPGIYFYSIIQDGVQSSGKVIKTN